MTPNTSPKHNELLGLLMLMFLQQIYRKWIAGSECPFIPQLYLSVQIIVDHSNRYKVCLIHFSFASTIFQHLWKATFSQSLIKFIPYSLSLKKVKIVESMEEEATTTTKFLLLKQKLDNRDQWSSSDHGGVQLSESSPTTTSFVELISTLVAVCGSYTFGNAVSTITILL